MRYTIYQLIDPRDGLPHYVGCTEAPERRLQEHLTRSHSRALTRWLKVLRQAGLQPVMSLLEDIDGTFLEAEQRETYWINHLRGIGAPLVNIQRNAAKHERITIYLPPHMVKRIRLQAASERKEISEVVEEYLLQTTIGQ